MKNIKVGDRVDVFWNSNNIDNEATQLLQVKVIHVPQAVGDLLEVEDGPLVYAINTGGIGFDCIVKRS
jgi:hypothetical protein